MQRITLWNSPVAQWKACWPQAGDYLLGDFSAADILLVHCVGLRTCQSTPWSHGKCWVAAFARHWRIGVPRCLKICQDPRPWLGYSDSVASIRCNQCRVEACAWNLFATLPSAGCISTCHTPEKGQAITAMNMMKMKHNETSMPLSMDPAELTRRDGAEKKRTVLVALSYAMRWFNMSLGT